MRAYIYIYIYMPPAVRGLKWVVTVAQRCVSITARPHDPHCRYALKCDFYTKKYKTTLAARGLTVYRYTAFSKRISKDYTK